MTETHNDSYVELDFSMDPSAWIVGGGTCKRFSACVESDVGMCGTGGEPSPENRRAPVGDLGGGGVGTRS